MRGVQIRQALVVAFAVAVLSATTVQIATMTHDWLLIAYWTLGASAIGGCLLAFIVGRRYTHLPVADGRVLCIVPAYNEPPESLARTLDALLAQTVEIDIVVIDDGSAMPVVPSSQPPAREVARQDNTGKRGAQVAVLRGIPRDDVRVRAHGRLRLAAVSRCLRAPAAGDVGPDVQAATGMIYVRNHAESWVARAADIDIGGSCVMMRASRSMLGALETTSGALALYRSSLLYDHLDAYAVECGTGDDRWLALRALRRGEVVAVAEALRRDRHAGDPAGHLPAAAALGALLVVDAPVRLPPSPAAAVPEPALRHDAAGRHAVPADLRGHRGPSIWIGDGLRSSPTVWLYAIATWSSATPWLRSTCSAARTCQRATSGCRSSSARRGRSCSTSCCSRPRATGRSRGSSTTAGRRDRRRTPRRSGMTGVALTRGRARGALSCAPCGSCLALVGSVVLVRRRRAGCHSAARHRRLHHLRRRLREPADGRADPSALPLSRHVLSQQRVAQRRQSPDICTGARARGRGHGDRRPHERSHESGHGRSRPRQPVRSATTVSR